METLGFASSDECGTTLTQPVRWFGEQSLSILEDRIVRRYTGIGNSREESFLFSEMRENPTRVQNTPWFGYAVGVGLLALTVLLFYLAHVVLKDDAPIYYGTGGALAVFVFIVLHFAVKKTFNVLVFVTARGPLLIQHNLPAPETYRPFIQLLQKKIAENRPAEKRSVQNALLLLRHAGVLDEWKYREACKLLEIPEKEE